LWLKRAWGCA